MARRIGPIGGLAPPDAATKRPSVSSDQRSSLRAMKRLVWLLFAGPSVYAVVWGVTWLTGDRSAALFGRVEGRAFSTYPGVLFGGLPPTPNMDSDLPQVMAALVGGLGIAVLLVIAFRRRAA
jgi:hypothetical protein